MGFSRLVLIALSAIKISAQVPAVIGCTQVGADPDSTFSFLHASASALGQAEEALVQAKQFQANRPVTDASGAVSVMTSMMTQTKLSSESYRCAMQLASTYSRSKDKGIRSAAEALTQAYSAHVQVNELFLEALGRWRDLSQHPEKMADIFSGLEVQRTNAWKILEESIVMTLLTSIDATRSDDNRKIRRIKITRQQRQELIGATLTLFPLLRHPKANEELDKPTFLADMSLIFLTKYKSSDEP